MTHRGPFQPLLFCDSVPCICCISEIVTGQNVALFGHTVVLCEPLLVECLLCGVVHHCWETDQDCYFAVLCNIDL